MLGIDQLGNVTNNVLLNFLFLGLFLNFIFHHLGYFITQFKVESFNKIDRKRILSFSQSRMKFMGEHNSKTKLQISRMLIWLPWYTVFINSIFIFFMMTKRGAASVISGVVKADSFAIIQLVKYTNDPNNE